MYKTADIRELVQEQHVRFLRLQFTDIFGCVKTIAVPITELERVLDNQVIVDGNVFTGMPGMQERVFLHPDYSTFILFPWRPRDGAVARLICNGYTKTGERFSGCSCGVLAETLEKAHPEYRLFVGVALDFFLFHVNERGKPVLVPQDYAGLCDLSPLDLGENVRRDLVNTLDEMGIDVVFSHHGEDPGKNRICLKAAALPAIADKIVTAKFIVRAVAQRHGLYASCVPKPFKGYPGAGMSLLLVLKDEDKNRFKGTDNAWGLSKAAYSFVAGLVKHAGGRPILSFCDVIQETWFGQGTCFSRSVAPHPGNHVKYRTGRRRIGPRILDPGWHEQPLLALSCHFSYRSKGRLGDGGAAGSSEERPSGRRFDWLQDSPPDPRRRDRGIRSRRRTSGYRGRPDSWTLYAGKRKGVERVLGRDSSVGNRTLSGIG